DSAANNPSVAHISTITANNATSVIRTWRASRRPKVTLESAGPRSGHFLEFLEDAPVAANAVTDAALTDRVPKGHDVNRQHGPVQPTLRFGGDTRRRQRRPQRQQRIDVIAGEFTQGVADIRLRDLRDQTRRRAFETLEPDHVEAGLHEIGAHDFVTARLVRG